ncbi:hypothetical protein [Anoxybacteroides tepidamans]|uniref:hypothetical protein n=1 Tax=Anoxybacteroides tepidamans TaxID=265948 RepID=UPI0018DB6585|nr:hypothetical protein [Anoxybacillus tepidamans]
MKKTMYSILLFLAGMLLYRYRYQALNGMMRIEPMQKLLVRVGMGIPAIRRTIVSQIFR